MPVCKCGRNIPENATCFCSTIGNPVIVYSNNSFNNIDISNIESIKNEKLQLSSLEFTRLLWETLHTYKYINQEEAKKWFEEWLKRVPCGECKEHSKLILEQNPIDFSTKRNFFESCVQFHNLVNNRLGKPKVSIEEAILLWDFKDL